MTENSLVIFTKASQMLAEANTIQKAKELKDLALTAADWAKRKGMGDEVVAHARSYALEAERKMGEMLKETERANAARDKKAESLSMTPPPTLKDIGLTKNESSKAQKLASLPKEIFEEIKTGSKSFTQAAREFNRSETKRTIPNTPTGKYRVFYADPPWKYGDQLTENYGPTRFHYKSMNITELCNLPINELAEDNAVLFIWVTSPLLSECWPVIKAWGFKYKTSFVWDKIKHNMGHYNSVRHEFLLICTRGSCVPDKPKLFDSVQSIERTEHSKKPEEFRIIIDTIYTHGKKIELFARKKTEGWEVWGDQV